MTPTYQVRSFTDVDLHWGITLWTFLNAEQIVRRMADASDDGRTAVEDIADDLYERFGEAVARPRVKQFIGFLVRQVMERNGYRHRSYGHRIGQNSVFSSGSRYVR